MAKVKDLTTGSPIRLMIMYALPVLIGNMCQQIYNFADTVIVGQCLGNDALAAVGTTGSMYFLVNGFVIGVTSGFSVHVAQCFGAKDYDRMRNSMFNAIFLWAVITVIITALSVFSAKPLLRLINTPDSIINDAYSYIVVIYAGIFAPLLYNAASCILRAVGDSKTPLYFLIVAAVLNIGLDFLFIMAFKAGIMGAAIATVISQFLSGALCVVFIHKKFPILHIGKKDFVLKKAVITKQLSIGLPMAFQFSITAIGTVVLQGAINNFGEMHIAAYTAGSKTEQLMTQMAGAIGVTTANFVGQNVGAGRYDRIRKGVWQWSLVTVIAASVAMLIMIVAGDAICMLFLKENIEETLAAARIYMRLTMLFYIPLFLIFVYRNALQAMGRTFMPLMAGVFELVARSVASLTLPAVIGFNGVCIAGPIAWVAAMVPLFITYTIVIVKIKKKGLCKPPLETEQV